MQTRRFEAMTVELSIPRDDPWRVYDHREERALRKNNGEIICLDSEESALRLADLMNDKVGWDG